MNIKKYKNYIIWAAKGFIMGASDIVPGVSGGTMALILGIYEKLIYSIRSLLDKNNLWLVLRFKFKDFLFKVPLKFLLSLGIGILLAIFTLSSPLIWLLQNKPIYLWAFFFGLVSASIFFVRKKVKKWPLKIWLVFSIGVLFAYIISGMIPIQTPATPLFFFLSGAIAISAMILPGISGSFLLVVLGKYEQILQAVNDKDFLTLGIFILGIIVGIAIFVRVLSWLLKHYHDITFAILLGLMIGSLRKVWPWKMGEINILPNNLTLENISIILLILLGFAFIMLILKLNHKKESRD